MYFPITLTLNHIYIYGKLQKHWIQQYIFKNYAATTTRATTTGDTRSVGFESQLVVKDFNTPYLHFWIQIWSFN